MRLADLHIKNFNTIRDMKITEIEDALILVGKNNTGKTAVLNAVRALSGDYEITIDDFNEKLQNIEIKARLEILEEDLMMLHKNGVVSQYKRYDAWKRDFQKNIRNDTVFRAKMPWNRRRTPSVRQCQPFFPQ